MTTLLYSQGVRRKEAEMCKRMIFLSLSFFLLTACTNPNIWVESIEIEVHDDLSSVVHFIVLQSSETISEETSDGGISTLDTFRNIFSETCEIPSLPFEAAASAKGFSGSKEFQNKTDLVYAISCIPFLSQEITIEPLQVRADYFGTSYKLEIDICNPAFLRNLQITLPGRIIPNDPMTSIGGYEVTTTYPSDDTVKWNIKLKDPTNPPQINLEPAEGAICTSPSQPPLITLVAQSRKSTIKIEWITTLCFGLLTLFFGGGAIWRLFEKSKKAQ